MELNDDGYTFEKWQVAVDMVLLRKCGLPADCLADYPSYDLWADYVSPSEAADICLVEWNDYV